MNRIAVAKELVRMAKSLLAIEFDTQEAYDDYIKAHPDADKSNHSVKRQENKSPAKEDVKNKKQVKHVEKDGGKDGKLSHDTLEDSHPDIKRKFTNWMAISDKLNTFNVKDKDSLDVSQSWIKHVGDSLHLLKEVADKHGDKETSKLCDDAKSVADSFPKNENFTAVRIKKKEFTDAMDKIDKRLGGV